MQKSDLSEILLKEIFPDEISLLDESISNVFFLKSC